MKAHRNRYKNEWDNESLVEHNLTCHSSEVQRRCTGPVDFYSPARAMADKENASHVNVAAIHEDAEDCARKLNVLLITKEASSPDGIHRANACASLRIASAIGYHCHGETLEAIGARLGKARQVIGRYCERFTDWSSQNCDSHLNTHTPETVISFCRDLATETRPLHDILDSFRQQLTDLFFDLLEAAEQLGQQNTEVYNVPAFFRKEDAGSIDVATLLEI